MERKKRMDETEAGGMQRKGRKRERRRGTDLGIHRLGRKEGMRR